MENGINILSLFDGMSCGQIAFKKLGVKVNKYYASEIDKPAITQTQHNFKDTIQLGNVKDIDVSKLEKIDILIGGSPCQSFSFAGKRKGMATKCEIEITRLEQYIELKSQGFEFEGQSYLFWEYIRILTAIRKYNPGVLFLLENVEMGKKWERVLSGAIGVFGVHINSALVSAQNRKRIYWTNIKVKSVGLFGELHSDIPQPADRGILIHDILQPENEVNEKYYIKNYDEKKLSGLDIYTKSRTIRCSTGVNNKDDKHNWNIIKLDKQLNLKADQLKAGCLTAGAHSGGNHSDMDIICVSMVGRRVDENGKRKDNNKNIPAVQRLEPNTDGKTGCLTSVQKDNLLLAGYKLRRFTPIECARLQTIPDWYKWVVSDTQIYKMLGNGWTSDVIAHILSFSPWVPQHKENELFNQLTA